MILISGLSIFHIRIVIVMNYECHFVKSVNFLDQEYIAQNNDHHYIRYLLEIKVVVFIRDLKFLIIKVDKRFIQGMIDTQQNMEAD